MMTGAPSTDEHVPIEAAGFDGRPRDSVGKAKGKQIVLWTLSIICFNVWLVGITTASTLHGYLHILLFLAGAALLARFVPRRHAVD